MGSGDIQTLIFFKSSPTFPETLRLEILGDLLATNALVSSVPKAPWFLWAWFAAEALASRTSALESHRQAKQINGQSSQRNPESNINVLDSFARHEVISGLEDKFSLNPFIADFCDRYFDGSNVYGGFLNFVPPESTVFSLEESESTFPLAQNSPPTALLLSAVNPISVHELLSWEVDSDALVDCPVILSASHIAVFGAVRTWT